MRQRGIDLGRQIGRSGQLVAIAEDRRQTPRHIALARFLSDKTGRNAIGFKRAVKPARPPIRGAPAARLIRWMPDPAIRIAAQIVRQGGSGNGGVYVLLSLPSLEGPTGAIKAASLTSSAFRRA